MENNEFDKASQEGAIEKEDGIREGYGTQSGYSRNYNSDTRVQRPRVGTQRIYSSNKPKQEEDNFRTEGLSQELQDNQNLQGGYNNTTSYRSRYNNYNDGNENGRYQPRTYNNRAQQGGYQPRNVDGYQSRYNSNMEENRGYQPRPYNNRPQQGGYQSRYNPNMEENGEYQPRTYNNRPQQGGYQPRNNNYNNGQGGYQPRTGYQPRNGYNQGGYQPRGNYQQQRGGYNQRGYQARNRQQEYNPNNKYSFKKRIEYKEENIDLTEPLRLNKFLANAGVCSRREADQYIQSGNVKVNGVVVTELGSKVLRTDEITFNDTPVTLEKKVYILINKPKDCVTTSEDPQQRKTVMDIVKGVCPERIYPVGRLDRNTTGVLLLTNDGNLASKLAHPKFLKKKVYHVFLDKEVTEDDLQLIATGIQLEDGEIHADSIEYASDKDKTQVGIEIHSGKNRIVRRIFEYLGYRVIKLDRVQFAGLTKKNLKRGDWRFLTEKEVDMLRMGAFE